MKRFKFRLETVQRVRQIQHDIARGELLAANFTLARASADVAQRSAHAHAVGLPQEAMSNETFTRHQFAISSAFTAARWSTDIEQNASERVDEHRQQWIETNTRLRAVERLRDRAMSDHRNEARIEADRLSDEITTAKFRERSVAR